MILTRRHYGTAAGVVLAIEIAVALWIDDSLVRPYLGDSLAVVLVYLAIRAATRLRVVPAASVALAIAVAIEIGQGLHLLRRVGLEHDLVARTILGGQFDPVDFIAYAAGAALILLAECALARCAAPR